MGRSLRDLVALPHWRTQPRILARSHREIRLHAAPASYHPPTSTKPRPGTAPWSGFRRFRLRVPRLEWDRVTLQGGRREVTEVLLGVPGWSGGDGYQNFPPESVPQAMLALVISVGVPDGLESLLDGLEIHCVTFY